MAEVLTYEFDEELEALLKVQGMEKTVRGIIRKALMGAKKQMVGNMRGQLSNDPRQAYKAVNYAVYKSILGGNLNILSRKKAGKTGGYSPRRPAGAKTRQLNSYQGADRGFVLRFMNAGTQDRTATTMNAHAIKRTSRPVVKGAWKNHIYKTRQYKTSTIGARGHIGAGNFFESAATRAMGGAMDKICTMIDEEYKQIFK